MKRARRTSPRCVDSVTVEGMSGKQRENARHANRARYQPAVHSGDQSHPGIASVKGGSSHVRSDSPIAVVLGRYQHAHQCSCANQEHRKFQMRLRLPSLSRDTHPRILAGCGHISRLREGEGFAQPTIPRTAVRISIGRTPFSRAIPAGFIGFSIEYPSVVAYAGPDPAAPNPLFLRLVRDLTPDQAPVIRVGGDTTDWTWWTTPGVDKPAGIRYTLNRRWIAVARATARALDARLILGINFESDRRAVAATEASALLKGIGRKYIAGFELGNEPEVYGSLGWYTTPGGVGVPGRAPSYELSSFLGD